MGIFFVSRSPAPVTITTALEGALLVDPQTLGDVKKEASHRSLQTLQSLSPSFDPWRFGGAILIAIVLLLAAIWTGQHNLPTISNALMNSFASFSGLVLGLLGGEAQKA